MPEYSISPSALQTESTLIGFLLSLWSIVVGFLILAGGVTKMVASPWQLAMAIMPGGHVGWGTILLVAGVMGLVGRLWYRRISHKALLAVFVSYCLGGMWCWAIAICHLIIGLELPLVGWLGFPVYALIGVLFLLHAVALRRIRTEGTASGP